jgi:hypothetical protein
VAIYSHVLTIERYWILAFTYVRFSAFIALASYNTDNASNCFVGWSFLLGLRGSRVSSTAPLMTCAG